jgi:hypothetical protein
MNPLAAVVVAAVALAASGAGARERNGREKPPEPPPWTVSPKQADSIYFYVVGSARDQKTPQEAREAAYQDALRQISRTIVNEAGVGAKALSAAGILVPMEGAEALPDCTFIEKTPDGFNGYVQVSFPIVQKRKIIARLKGG